MRRMDRRAVLASLTATGALAATSGRAAARDITIFQPTTEFELQDYIWLTWGEAGFLGGRPMTDTTLPLIRALAPHVKIRLLYSQWTSWQDQAANPEPPRTLDEARARIGARLTEAGVDLGRVEFIRSPYLFGAIQDPGPVFLRDDHGRLAIADFASAHPEPIVSRLDREVTAGLGVEALSSSMKSDGGNLQFNGNGVLMLGEAFARSVNPDMTREQIEQEYRRMFGVAKIIWLQHGPREEDWGLLEDGRWGIGTAGHIDEFARFVDERTVILSEVPEAERDADPIRRETHRRMEENFAILSAARDAEGRPFNILRAPTALPMAHRIAYDDLSPIERFWFEGAGAGDQLEFYLPGSYLNFVIANGVVVTSRYWREGMPDAVRQRDAEGLAAVQAAFSDRTVVAIDAMPLLHDGAGIHCYTRNQPKTA